MEISPKRKKSEITSPTTSFHMADVFFQGDIIVPEEIIPSTLKIHEHNSFKYLNPLMERIKLDSKANLVFDIDGVLTEISLETAANPKLLSTWAQENKKPIEEFRSRVGFLKKTGDFRLSICTGRSWDYAKRITDLLFPTGSLDYAVVEGGAIVASKPEEDKEWKLRPAASVDRQSLADLDKYRQIIIDHATKDMGAALEPKRIRLTLNPPQGTTGEMFKGEIREFLKELARKNPQDKEILERISNHTTHTPTTVEIMPSGIDKLLSLKEMSGKNITIYFGDANTDKSAMSNADINIAPGNAETDIKNYVRGDKTREFIGILSTHTDIKGINKAMQLIRVYYNQWLKKEIRLTNARHIGKLAINDNSNENNSKTR